MFRDYLLIGDKEEQAAVLDGGEVLFFRDLARKAEAVCQLLRDERRERAAVFLPNGGAFISAFFGTVMAGSQVFPLNIQLTGYEISALLIQACVHTVLTDGTFLKRFEEIREAVPFPLRVICVEDLPEPKEGRPRSAPLSDPQEPMVLLNTSGTTGKAKIVQLSESNLEYCVRAYLDQMDYERIPREEIRYMIAAPFSSAYGLLILAACAVNAFPLVLMKEEFTLEAFYKTVQTQRVTHYEGGVMAAVLMDQMGSRRNPYDIGSLRYMGLAGSKISSEILHRLTRAYPKVEFWTGYGMTEASPLIAKPYKKMPPEKFASVGTAIRGETLLVETGGGKTDAPYTKGEILVKGPNVMLGYYNDEEETQRIIKDGFLYTGDIGYFDEDGYLYICGRRKNVVIVRGFNVYPEEIEVCLQSSGLAKECIVYGETDARGNEIVCADIVPCRAGICEKDIKAYCGAHLSAYKQPQKIRIRENVVKTATGKVKKDETENKGANLWN